MLEISLWYKVAHSRILLLCRIFINLLIAFYITCNGIMIPSRCVIVSCIYFSIAFSLCCNFLPVIWALVHFV